MQKFLKDLLKFLPVFLLITIQSSKAQELSPELKKADSLFTAKAYTEALEAYESLLEQGEFSNQMLAKMAFIQEGFENHSQALYYLSLLNRQSPNEATLRKLEELSKSHNLEGYAVSDESYFLYLYRRYKSELLLVLSIIGLLGLGGIFISIKRGYSPIASSIALGIYGLAILWIFNFQSPTPMAIVVKDQAFVMNSPSAGGSMIASLNSGHRLPIISKFDIWYEVEWKGQKAFVRQNNVRVID